MKHGAPAQGYDALLDEITQGEIGPDVTPRALFERGLDMEVLGKSPAGQYLIAQLRIDIQSAFDMWMDAPDPCAADVLTARAEAVASRRMLERIEYVIREGWESASDLQAAEDES